MPYTNDVTSQAYAYLAVLKHGQYDIADRLAAKHTVSTDVHTAQGLADLCGCIVGLFAELHLAERELAKELLTTMSNLDIT